MGWRSSLAADEKLEIQLDLVGQRQLHRDMAMVAADIQAVERATDRAGTAMQRTARHGFLWNQAMFTARRLVYDFSLAVGAAVTAVGVLGFNFNRNMETSTVALKFLLGSEEAATKELSFLYELAAKTPFQFAELTDVSRRFLSWGFSVQFTNRALTATADAMAAMGGDPEIIRRIVRAFGQIRSRGKVMGEELNQLAEAGIPAYKFLQEELGLTGEQLAKVGTLGIPANVALEAIIRGMERTPDLGGFKGAAEELSTTVTGQLSTIADYSQQLFGMATLAPFYAFRNSLPGVALTLQTATEAMKDRGFFAMVQAFDDGANAGGRLVAVLEYITGVGKDVATIFSEGIWPALWMNTKILLGLLLPALWVFAQVLGVVASVSDYLAPVIAILTFWWLAEKTALILNTIWTARNTGAKRLAALWTLILAREEQLLAFWRWANVGVMRVYLVLMGLGTAAGWRMVAATTAVAFATWFANTALGALILTITTFLLTNPVGWIILAVGALALLEYKFGAVSRSVTWLWDKLKSFRNWIANNAHGFDILNLIPGVGAARQGWRLFKGLGGLVGLAGGGSMLNEGMVMVGERGPELLHLPARASVEPLAQAKVNWGEKGSPFTILPAPVNIDGREVAEIVFEHRLDRFARA